MATRWNWAALAASLLAALPALTLAQSPAGIPGVVAREGLYRLRMLAQGPERLGK